MQPWCLLKMSYNTEMLSTPYEKGDYESHNMEKVGEGGGGGPCLDAMGVKNGSRRQLRLGRLFVKELGDIICHGESLGNYRIDPTDRIV